MKPPIVTRLWDYIEPLPDAPGCWLWSGRLQKPSGKNMGGYGVCSKRVGPRSREAYVHRLLYESMRGPIPEGLQIDHLCRVRSCVNPWHMETVTSKVNLLRGNSLLARYARSATCVHGHPFDGVFRRRAGNLQRTCSICTAQQRARTVARRRLRRQLGSGKEVA